VTYIVSLGLGLTVGVAYALLGVRSPAPPIVALVGLFGMVTGEQGALVVKAALKPAALSSTAEEIRP
jgi:XapX domain-containing protein